MSTVAAQSGAAAPIEERRRPVAPIPFGRVLGTEIRKLVDTRASLWLLGIILVLSLVICVLIVSLGDDHTGDTFTGLFTSGGMAPMSLLLPVVGALTFTTEWSKRTALTTYTLEPRRLRVFAAKLIATVLMGLLVTIGAAVISALATLVAGARGATKPWSFDVAVIVGAVVVGIAGLLMGAAFGALLANTPLAIVAFYGVMFFLMPALSVAGAANLAQWVTTLNEWINVQQAWGPLSVGRALTGTEWAHLASTTVIWIIAPFVAGAWLTTRREVK